MRALARRGFFDALDSQLCQADPDRGPIVCAHNFDVSKSILKSLGFPDDVGIIEVLEHLGACCDCEVLYNVAEDSRLKAKYWRAQIQEDRP